MPDELQIAGLLMKLQESVTALSGRMQGLEEHINRQQQFLPRFDLLEDRMLNSENAVRQLTVTLSEQKAEQKAALIKQELDSASRMSEQRAENSRRESRFWMALAVWVPVATYLFDHFRVK